MESSSKVDDLKKPAKINFAKEHSAKNKDRHGRALFFGDCPNLV